MVSAVLPKLTSKTHLQNYTEAPNEEHELWGIKIKWYINMIRQHGLCEEVTWLERRQHNNIPGPISPFSANFWHAPNMSFKDRFSLFFLPILLSSIISLFLPWNHHCFWPSQTVFSSLSLWELFWATNISGSPSRERMRNLCVLTWTSCPCLSVLACNYESNWNIKYRRWIHFRKDWW